MKTLWAVLVLRALLVVHHLLVDIRVLAPEVVVAQVAQAVRAQTA
jgi:hypothetical protein